MTQSLLPTIDTFLPKRSEKLMQLSFMDRVRLWEFYERYCLKMESYYGEGHWILLCHAAFPVVITPDLLYKLWMNFRSYPKRDHSEAHDHSIQFIAVSDILLSGLFKEVGFEQFELVPNIRFALLEWLKMDKRFCDQSIGQDRIKELAEFLSAYLEESFKGTDPGSVAYREGQEWAITSYLQPETAIRKMYQEFLAANENKDQNKRKLLRLNRALEQLQTQYSLRVQINPEQDQTSKLKNLLEYSRGTKNLLMGKEDQALTAFRKLPNLKDHDTSNGKRTPQTLSFPAAIGGESVLPEPEDGYDGEQIYALLVGVDTFEDRSLKSLPPAVKNLNLLENYLRKHHKEKDLRILPLLNEQATYGKVIHHFQDHFRKARAEDTVLFYFSGLSGQFEVTEELQTLFAEQEGQESGLYLYDSKVDGTNMLTNLELLGLLLDSMKDDRNPDIQEYPRIVVILEVRDSEKNIWQPTSPVISFPKPTKSDHPRPLSSYLEGRFLQTDLFLTDLSFLLLGAGAKDQRIYDKDGMALFTQSLVNVLSENIGELSYQETFDKTNIRIQKDRSDQTPIMVSRGGFDPALGVFDKKIPIKEKEQGLPVYYTPRKGWVLDAGFLHGYQVDQEIEILAQGNPIAKTKIKRATLQEGRLDNVANVLGHLDPDIIYSALPPVLHIGSIFTEHEEVKQMLQLLDINYTSTNDEESADWCIHVNTNENRYWISRDDMAPPLYLLGTDRAQIQKALTQIATWTLIRELENTVNNEIQKNELEILVSRQMGQDKTEVLNHQEDILDFISEEGNNYTFSFSAINRAVKGDINVCIFALSGDFGIEILGQERVPNTGKPVRISLKTVDMDHYSFIENKRMEIIVKYFYSYNQIKHLENFATNPLIQRGLFLSQTR